MLNQNEIVMASLTKNFQKEAKDSKAVLLISINGENTGEKFAATADLIKYIGFQEVTIVVACELQMNTLYGSGAVSSLEEGRLKGKELGEAWVLENQNFLKEFQVLRWGDFVEKEEYKKIKLETDSLYIQNESVKNSLKKTVEDFTARHDDIIDKQLMVEQSIEYIKNESPIIPYFLNKGYSYILYNNSPNKSFKALMDYYNLGENKIEWLRFDFNFRNIDTLKLNSLQTKKHGFSCGREYLAKKIKSNKDSNIFFLSRKKENINYNYENNLNLIFQNIEADILSIKDKIDKLTEDQKEIVMGYIQNKLFEINDLNHKKQPSIF